VQENFDYRHLISCTLKFSQRPNSVKIFRASGCIRWLTVQETNVLRIISLSLSSGTLPTHVMTPMDVRVIHFPDIYIYFFFVCVCVCVCACAGVRARVVPLKVAGSIM